MWSIFLHEMTCEIISGQSGVNLTLWLQQPAQLGPQFPRIAPDILQWQPSNGLLASSGKVRVDCGTAISRPIWTDQSASDDMPSLTSLLLLPCSGSGGSLYRTMVPSPVL